jgi:hypothetical protein
VENIPLQAERDSGEEQKLFAFSPEQCSLSDRNTVRNHNGMVFGFKPESRSPSTGFPSRTSGASLHKPQSDLRACRRGNHDGAGNKSGGIESLCI